jgi:hypothetical protein
VILSDYALRLHFMMTDAIAVTATRQGLVPRTTHTQAAHNNMVLAAYLDTQNAHDVVACRSAGSSRTHH